MATTIRVNAQQLGPAVSGWVLDRLQAARLDQVLVGNSKRRIRNQGDSEEAYTELWATQVGLGYRAGGLALWDTGILINALHGSSQRTEDALKLFVVDGTPSGYGLKHQEGFTIPGPYVLPLSVRAARVVPKEHPHDVPSVVSQLQSMQMLEGPLDDYIIVQGDSFVPPRRIVAMPPEDVQDLVATITRVLTSGA